MGRGLLAVVVVGLVLALGAGKARADAVPPSPDDCPEGSVGGSSHEGPFCFAVSCNSNLSCPSPATCEPRSFCLIGTNLKLEGGTCEDTSDCPVPAVCRKLQACVEPSEDAGCACGEARGAGAGAGLGAALACGALVSSVARRRRARRAR